MINERAISLESIALRIVLVLTGAGLIAFLLLSSTWFFGDAIASGANVREIAEFAKDLDPDNPRAYRVASLISENSFLAEDLKSSLKDAETALSLSPHDYTLWQTLARLRERGGDIAGAEKALRKATDLAPHDASIQWALGNVLLRQEKFDEAFQLIRTAVGGHPPYAGPAASIAWDIYSGDLVRVKAAVGKSDQVVAALAVYLAGQKRFDESFEIWNSIPAKERRQKYTADAKTLLSMFSGHKKYLGAALISADVIVPGGVVPKPETVTNGSFELDIASDVAGTFDWVIAAGNVPSIGISVEAKKSGKRSLVVQFEGGPGSEFRDVSQVVAVRGGKTYTLSFNSKSALKTDATLQWRVFDALTGEMLASSDSISAQSNWQEISTGFNVPDGTEGVILRLVRADCTDLRCPIVGTVWFDDITIK